MTHPFDYPPAPESRETARLKPSYGVFIDGGFRPGGGAAVTSLNPADETPLAEVGQASAADVDEAVAAARAAFDGPWARTSGAERAKYLFRIARVIAERSRELAVLETLDNGKPITETRDVDVPTAAAHFFYYAGWADKLDYANLSPRSGFRPGPVGVAGQIIPWNFPLLMAAWKIAPALAAGNTVVLKPAETTPLTALTLAEIIADCELPPGVVNILPGGPAIGQAIVGHPGVDKIAFTGSTEVGKLIAKSAAVSGQRLTLELGGKGANIVFADAPIDEAVEGIINGIFFNQGQVCCAGSRLLVQESIAEELIAALKRRLATLRLGDPLDKNTDIGAINSAAQLARITALAGAGEAEGAERWTADCVLPERGYWFAPTIFTGVSQSSRIAREEVFGPVLSVLTFRTAQEAVDKANNTPFGLSAGVWTEKGSRILWMASRLRAGVVWANTFNRFDPASPFGGYRESGFGREGGRHGLAPYLSYSPSAGATAASTASSEFGSIATSAPAADAAPADKAVDTPSDGAGPNSRLPVRKTYKLFLGGAFPRSESGRTYPVVGAGGSLRAHAAQASRKDLRDAVTAARGGFAGWSGASAYNRGQVLYRVAEMMEGRQAELATAVADAEGLGWAAARGQVEAAVDSWVWHAGWTDKISQVLGSTNPVAGPYFNFSTPEPTGVVGLFADAESSLLGLVSGLAPIIAVGNTVVALAAHARPLPALVLAECLATADVPAGVVNILSGDPAELGPWLAGHRDVNGLDLTFVNAADRPALAIAAADSVTRVFTAEPVRPAQHAAADGGLADDPGIERLLAFLEIKTVWHPAGL